MQINNEINEQFLTACSSGDLASVTHIYFNHYLKYKTIKSKFLSFLKLSNSSDKLLNPFYQENLAFRYACNSGNTDVISYLLNDKFFRTNINAEDLGLAIGVAISINDIGTIKTIEPFVQKDRDFYDYIYKGFLEACREGHLDAVKYTLENLNQNNYLDSIDIDSLPTDGFAPNRTIKESGFIEACNGKKIDIVEYLLSDYSFATKYNNPILSEGLCIAIKHKNEDLIKIISSAISEYYDKNVHYYYNIGKYFYDACSDGNLNDIKYLLTNKNIDIDYSDLFSRPFGTGITAIILSGFLKACSMGHLEVVKYFTKSEELPIHINVKKIKSEQAASLIIKDYDVVQYLVFELNLEKEECFMFMPKEFEAIFDKKKLKDELEASITNQFQHTPTKRLKI